MIPSVSILLPAFDAAPTIEACLRSIECQSSSDWECIVVDDGSRDETAAIVAATAGRDPRFRLVSAEHAGLVAALQLGLRHCRGRYVARMDADDLMRRDRLAAQTTELDAHPELAGVGSWVRVFPRPPRAHGPSSLQKEQVPRDPVGNRRPSAAGRRLYEAWLNAIDSPQRVRADAFIECPIAHPTLMMRREVIAATGYRDCGWPEDYDLILRLLGAGHEIGVVRRRLLLWRDSPARLSRTAAAYGIERFTACKAAHLASGFLSRADRYVLCGYGSTGRALRRALLAHDKRPAAIADVHPRRLGFQIHGARVIACDDLTRFRGLPIVASVAGAAARREIRAAFGALGFAEGRDFVCAA